MSLFKNINVAYVYVRDWAAAKKFYTEVLGWPLVFCSDEIGWCEFGLEDSTHFAINRLDEADPDPGEGSRVTITFTVEDVHATTAALRARGVRCAEPFHIPGVVLYGTFYDPEGNRFQFVSSQT